MKDRIAACFAATRAQGRAALVTFVTAGDPNPETSSRIVAALARGGADMIELGMPFTDPIADGPTIQAANLRALHAGTKMGHVLNIAREFRRTNDETPLILMGYMNPVLAYGARRFAEEAAAAGVDGAIIVDMPPEEAGDLDPELRRAGLCPVRLATPTTDAARLPHILDGASGFLYYVSMAGVTGTRDIDRSSVAAAVTRLRAACDLPIAVGFGVKTPEQAATIGACADAVVVGSALVRCVGEKSALSADDLAREIENVTRDLRHALSPVAEQKR